jgi:hypothetical protein
MSIISAIKEARHDSNNLEDLAKLPQTLIMSMVQRGEIKEYMLTPILGMKAEMAEDAARMQAAKQLAAQGGAIPTVLEQDMAKIAQAENPAPPMPQQQMQQPQQPMPQQMAQQPMPQGPEDVGIASQATQPMSMAGGGIVAFSGEDGSEVEVDPEDDYQDLIDQAEEDATNEEIYDLINQMAEHGGRGEHAAVGIRSGENKHIKEDTRERATKHISNEDQARRHNVGNLRPSGFSYPGQVGTSKGGFAMFESPESGLNALHHDIGIKLNRGLDTPTKFISVYAPAGDKNDVGAYSGNVAKMLGIGPNDKIPNTPEARQMLANAIIRQEGAHKATAAFAGGGEVKHYVLGDYVMDDFGSSRGADPRSTAMYDEFGRTPAELEAEIQKSKKVGRPLSKEAQKYLNSKATAASPKTPTPGATTPYERYIKPAMGRPSVAGAAVPAGILAGGTQLGVSSMDTMTDNPYFEGYSDPFMGDMAVGNAILNATKDKRREADAKKEGFVDPNIERLKKQTVYDTPVRAPAQKASTEDATPREKAEEETFNLMKYAQQQRADRLKAAEMDKWQAGLAAGLGMLGGTSPYAMVNIGQGGQMGVQQLANSQRLRASQDIADNKLLGTAYNANMVNKYRNAALGQSKELGEARLNQDMIKAREAHIDKVMKDRHGMDMAALGQLRRQRDLGKLDADKLKDLERLERTIKQVETDAFKKYPMQTSRGSSGVIRLD